MNASYDNVKIELPYEILRIEDFKLTGKFNEHYRFDLEAVIEEKNMDKYMMESSKDKEIKVYINNKIIYVGKIIGIEILYKMQTAYLKLKSISYSYDLDIKKHNQVFIDLSATYEDVIKKVLSKYSKASFRDDASNGNKTSELIVQYEETDWEFLKRLATHFQTILIPEVTCPLSRFWFGIEINYEKKVLEKEFIEVKNDFKEFNKIRNSSKKQLLEQEFITWEIESYDYFSLGTQFIYYGQEVCISRLEMKVRKGEVVYSYEIKLLNRILTSYKTNSKLKGVTLEAIVKERRNNEMQLHFCINDSYEESGNNKWFHYCKEVENFYSMPVIGSKMHVSFLTEDEKNSVVTSSVRIAGQKDKYYGKIANSNNKSYSTVDGQELLMTPDMIQIAQDDSKRTQITLGKGGNVSITGKNISLSSSKNIEIGTNVPSSSEKNSKPKSINISAKNSVTVTRSSSSKSVNTGESIQLAEENHVRGIAKLGR